VYISDPLRARCAAFVSSMQPTRLLLTISLRHSNQKFRIHCWALNNPATIVGALCNRGNGILVLILTEGLLVGYQVELEYPVTVMDMRVSVTVKSAYSRTRRGV